MILISYDGSVDAQAAIDQAARLMPRADATVLTVWEPFIDSMARHGALGMGYGMTSGYGLSDTDSIDTATREAALATAVEGAERASGAGLVANARAGSRNIDVAGTILVAGAGHRCRRHRAGHARPGWREGVPARKRVSCRRPAG